MTIPDEAVQADKTLWCVHITGPDDIISAPDHLSAVRMANTFNAWWLDLITKTPLTDNHPRMWAEPIEWPYSEGHGEDVTDPKNEYQWLRELAALPFLQGVKVKGLEWVKGDVDENYYFANSSIQNYIVTIYPDDGLNIRLLGTSPHGSWHSTLEAAKAAAQADYEARILSAIEIPTTSKMEAVAPSPRAQALEEGAILEALEECETYFDNLSDADHDETGFVANKEMRILVSVRAAIRALSSQEPVCVNSMDDARRQAFIEGFEDAVTQADNVVNRHDDTSKQEVINSILALTPDFRALSSQPVAEGWLPIETAPKDGTEIIGFRPDQGRFLFRWATMEEIVAKDIHGDAVEDYDEDFADWWHGIWGWMEGDLRPTHWRPLPASPGASECPTCHGTGMEGKNSICRDCEETRPTGGSNNGE